MDNAKRITPEQVLEAFQKTGLKPKQGHFFYDNYQTKCACGLGAVYVADMIEKGKTIKDVFDEIYAEPDEIDDIVYDFFNDSCSEKYRNGFINGFDETFTEATVNKASHEDFKNGYEDGKAAYQAVKHLIQ